MTIWMLVKGDTQAAHKAAEQRGIRAAFAYADGVRGEVMLLAAIGDIGRVTEWFTEAPHHAPYPIGSLLHYSVGPERLL